jgi:hypothetical protein
MRITFTDPTLVDSFVAYLERLPGWAAEPRGHGQIEIAVPDAGSGAAEQRRISAHFRSWRKTLPAGRRIDFVRTRR